VSKDGINWSYRKIITPTMTSPSLNGVIAMTNRYYAVGQMGAVLVSPDGLNWETLFIAKNLELTDIEYNGTMFVATGVDIFTGVGALLYSKDAINWLQVPVNIVARFNSVAWNGLRFVAVGEYAGIAVGALSGDGITWKLTKINAPATTTQTSGGKMAISELRVALASPLNAITWTGTEFVAAGQGGTIIRSNDGINWVLDASGTNVQLYDVTSSKTHILITGDKGTILTSPVR
jgi:hypothetical protein